jgi:hypothetical protein
MYGTVLPRRDYVIAPPSSRRPINSFHEKYVRRTVRREKFHAVPEDVPYVVRYVSGREVRNGR